MPQAMVRAIEYHLPMSVLTNDDLAAMDAKWTSAAIEAKTGIRERHIAAPDECASDLAIVAATRLLDSGICSADDLDYLLFCTQCPDYFLPTTACLLQQRLGLPTNCGALDFNLGCSGYIYGLGLAKGLIETGQAQRVLLVTADTYSKYLHHDDLHVRTVFGDGAAATLIVASETRAYPEGEIIGPFVYGTDGRGAENLIVADGGLRRWSESKKMANADEPGLRSRDFRLVMDGPEIFRFTIEAVPRAIDALLERSRLNLDDIQLFVFHQANQFMLDHLRRKIGIPEERFCLAMRDCGNTVSASIPIALKHAMLEGRVRQGDRVALVGFGVGYSWGATLLRWTA
jgi:3-oxoacyl-[acyl-carrier-protein] synthase III